ncbi:MAG: PAP2 family protein, partial [Gammaproteobacteria bacterium]
MTRLLRSYGDVLAALALAIAFACWPATDLASVQPFYRPGAGFAAGPQWWVSLIYLGVARFWLLALVFAVLLAAGYSRRWGRRWRRHRRALAYLLATLVLGPGLIVNTVLKDHWGRPRPVHLVQFG